MRTTALTSSNQNSYSMRVVRPALRVVQTSKVRARESFQPSPQCAPAPPKVIHLVERSGVYEPQPFQHVRLPSNALFYDAIERVCSGIETKGLVVDTTC